MPKNIINCLVGLGLSLALVGCVMEGEQMLDFKELEVESAEDIRVEFVDQDGESTEESEYSPECVPLPAGSYRLTCGPIRVACDRSWMDAYCRRRNGTWMWSPKLWYPFSCSRDIANIDGTLRCQ